MARTSDRSSDGLVTTPRSSAATPADRSSTWRARSSASTKSAWASPGRFPADLAQEVSAALIREGRVRRSWIGLDVQPRLKSDAGHQGALVGSTIEGSPAAKAGFVPGDLLVRLGDNPVNVQFAEEVPLFNQIVMRLPLGRPRHRRGHARGSRNAP